MTVTYQSSEEALTGLNKRVGPATSEQIALAEIADVENPNGTTTPCGSLPTA